MKASTILLNFLLWPLMQMGLARLFVMLPHAWFRGGGSRRFRDGELRFLRNMLRIKTWKRFLPDGERWVGGGFSKRSLQGASRQHLRRYVTESRRGEATHWTAIVCSFAFFAWNPRFSWPGIFLLALLLNGPCIAAQRYNRAMLLRWLARG